MSTHISCFEVIFNTGGPLTTWKDTLSPFL